MGIIELEYIISQNNKIDEQKTKIEKQKQKIKLEQIFSIPQL
jgi:hypothetical protein